MKKLSITIMLFIASITVSAQTEWTSNFYVDEFNEPTDQGYTSVLLPGTFSNSATHNSDLTMKVSSSNSAINIDLFEYNRQPSAKLVYTGTYGTFKVKQGGQVYTVRAWAAESGGLYIWKFKGTKKTVVTKEYALFNQILTDGGEIMFSIREDDFDSGSSTYVVKANISPMPNVE